MLPLPCDYAFYYRPVNQPAVFDANTERFPAASLIKLPILLAWTHLERTGQVNRADVCHLDDDLQVQGAGFSWLLRGRSLLFQDALLLMTALSDNLCTNLVIQHIGLEQLNAIFSAQLGLHGTQLQRKMMDFAARAAGRDNWITASDCVRLFELFHALTPDEKAWVEPMLLANQDGTLLMRDVPRDTLEFYHKTGLLPGALHDWGYTRSADIFLLTNGFEDEVEINQAFGEAGRLLLP